MTKREKLELLLEEVKQQNNVLDASEERLLQIRELVLQSAESETSDDERKRIQNEINSLLNEIKLLNIKDTNYH